MHLKKHPLVRLEITAPVAAAALPRRIEVKTAPVSKQIAA
jgi:hypothetical protein